MAIVNADFNSLTTLRHLKEIQGSLSKSIERLATGQNLKTDDPSGFAYASTLSGQIGGSREAVQNAEDAISLTQTAYDVLDEMTEMLLRMRDIAIRAENDATLTTADFTDLNSEFADLRTEINRQALGATFNRQELLTGSFAAGKPAQVGPDNNANQQMPIVIANAVVSVIASGTDDLWSVAVLSAGAAGSALSVVDRSLDYVGNIQTSLGVQQRALTAVINSLSSAEINLSAARSRITDADMASEISRFAKLQIVSEAGVAVLAHANDLEQRVVGIMDTIIGI